MTAAMAATPWFSALADRDDALPAERVAMLVARIARGDADRCRGASFTPSTISTTSSARLDEIEADDLYAPAPATASAAGPGRSRASDDPARRSCAPRSRATRSRKRGRPSAPRPRPPVRTDARSGRARRSRRRASGTRGRTLGDVERPPVLLVEPNAVPARETWPSRDVGRARRRRSHHGRSARASPPRAEDAGSACREAFPPWSSGRCSPGRAAASRPAAASSSGSHARAKNPRSSSCRSSSTTTAPEIGVSTNRMA